MSTAANIIGNIVPVSDFSHGKASSIFRGLTDRIPVTVVKNNRPVAVITTPEEFAYLSEAEESIVLLELALERLAVNSDKEAVPFDEILAGFNIGQADIDAIPDAEIEFE